jgi:hypothetical protein
MNEQKSFIHYIVEAIDRYRIEQRARASEQGTQSRTPSRLRRFLRWLTPNGGSLLLVIALIATAQVWAKPLASPASPGPSATTVNYQGRLSDSDGVPLDGTYGMSFALYDAATDGGLVWGPEEHTAVEVSDGLFSVGLGSKTSGGIPTTTWNGDRYLEITVGGETLEPRELIRSVPIAGMALTVPDGAIAQDQAPSLLEGPGDDYRVETGSFYFHNGSDGWREKSVDFDESFTSAPKVFITLYGSAGPVEIEYWENAGIHSVDSSGFTVKAFAKSVSIGIRVNWIAIGH